MKKCLFFLTMLFTAYLLNAQTVIYQESFDPPSNADSVTAAGAANNFAINSRLFYSGNQCDSNLVTTNDTAYLTTNSFSTMGYSYVFLNFSHICKIQLLDAGEVQVSIDNGLTWTQLTGTHYVNPGNSQFVTSGNKFNANTYPALWQPTTDAAKPTNAWWKNESFNISAIVGNQANVRIRFALRDGNGNGAFFNHGWFIDNISVTASISELTPPAITCKPPVVSDTVFHTGPFDIFSWIRDASGIDTAYLVYKLNNGPNMYIPMVWVSDSTYKATIPQFTFNNRIDYYVYAADNSASHNFATGCTNWFYIKKGPSVVQIGTGTATGTWPFYEYWGYTRSGAIYTSSEINMNGSITSLAWSVATAAAPNCPVKIYLKTTTATTFTAGEPWANLIAGATLVYTGTVNFATTGWKTFIPTTSFNYLSGNLMVLCEANYGGGGVSPYAYFHYTPTTGNTHQTYYADNTPPSGTGAINTARPNIKIGFPAATLANDAGVKQILTPTGTIIANVNVPVTLYIKNFGTDTLKKATIQWKLDGVTQTAYPWVGALPEAITSGVLPIGFVNVPVGSHSIKAWTVAPNDSVDNNKVNDTSVMNFYACTSILNGNYTIGATGDYATFTAALNALSNCGISGPVTFNVQSGTYVEQVSFPEISGASAVNTITFQSLTGNKADVTLQFATTTANNYVLKLNGGDHFRFKNMTLKSVGTTFARVIELNGNAINNQFDGNDIIGVTATGNSTDLAVVFSPALANSSDSLTVFNNNIILNGSTGILLNGTSGTVLENKTTITNNTLTNQYFRGIDLVNQNAPKVISNTITTNTAYTDFYSISMNTCNNDFQVMKNKVVLNTGGTSILLIYCIGTLGKEGLTANNSISMGGTNTALGINYYYSSRQKCFYNSIYVYSSGINSKALGFAGNSNTFHEVKNNICFYGGTQATGYAIYVSPTTLISSSNYNDLYSTGPNLGYWNANMATFTAWKNASLQDAQSVSVNPAFFSPTNLMTILSDLNGKATPIPGITDDIMGNPRNATTPDIGAYEFNPPANNIGMVAVLQPVSSCALSTSNNVVIRVKNFGGANITTANVYYRLNGGTPVSEVMNQTILPDSSYNYTFTQTVDLSTPGNYVIKAYVSMAGDTLYLNDTINNYTFYSGFNFTASSYTMGFEPTENFSDWSKLDVNADNATWTMPHTASADARTGANCVRLNNSSVNAGNDWLFSRCFSMMSGNTYKIDFWYKVSNAANPQIIDLKVGNTNTVGGMTTTLTSLVSVANTSYQKASVNFTPPTSGTYYFGWWGHSIPNSQFAYIDDINISILPPQEAAIVSIIKPKTGCGLSNAEQVTIKVQNTGGTPITSNFTAYYKVNNGTVYSQPITNTIAVNDTLWVTFNQPADLSVTTTDQTFSVKAWVSLTGDPLAFNDTLVKPVTSYHVPVLPIVTNQTIPWGTATTLHAISPDSVFWYNAPTGGTQLAISHHYTTPTLYNNTVYYAEAALFTPNIVSTIGNGTNVQGYPFYTYFHDSKTQILYTASEILAAGGGAGSIDKIAFNIASIGSPAMSGFTVQMQHSSLSSLTGFTDIGWTTVYTSTSYIPAATGWQDITLQTPFFYNGSSNLLINICFDNTSYVSNTNVNCTNAPGKVWHAYTDGAVGCALTGGSGQVDRPNIRFNQSAKGCASARVADTVFMSLFPNEASVIAMPQPIDGCTDNAAHVSIRIVNNGTATMNNFQAKYKVNNAAFVTETVTTPILSGDSLTFTFNTTFNPGLTVTNQDSTFTIIGKIVVTGDPVLSNDSIVKNVDLLYSPPSPVVTNVTIPFGTSTTLHAVSSDTVFWFNVPTGGIELAQGANYTTPVLYGTTVYWAEARTGAPDMKITEVTHYSTGTGSTIGAPSYIVGSDFIELTNLGSADINLQNYTMNIYGEGSRTFTLPNVTVGGGQVLVLHAGTGTDSPANLFYNMGGGNDIISSASISGFALKDPSGVVVDAVASNGYTFTAGNGVTATDWSGNILNMSGFAGSIRTVSDNNISTDWIISSTSTTQTLGTMNPALSGGGSGSGCASIRVPDTVFINGIPACDMSVIQIQTPNSGVLLTTNEAVTIEVKNYGAIAASNIPVSYQLNSLAPVNATIPGPIASNASSTFTFPLGVDLSAFATYTLKVYTGLVCDTTHINDTLVKTITNAPLVYCTSVPSSAIDEEIFSVTLNGATNNYNCTTVAPGPGSILNRYSNFTTLLPLTTLSMGVPVSFTIEQDECDGSPYYSNGIGIWIDLNRDGDFTDANEAVYIEQTLTSSPRTVTGTFTVPAGSFSGITTMRIICAEGASGTALTPCMTYGYGETEDHAIRIAAPVPKDAGAITFHQPTVIQDEGVSVPVKLIVKNFGTDTIKNSSNMTVSYRYNNGAIQSVVYAGGNMPPLDTALVTLPNFVILANSKPLCGWTALPGDTLTYNDTICTSILGVPQMDAGVTNILTPALQLVQGTPEVVSVVFKNFGVDTITTVSLGYKINGVVQATEIWSGSLLPSLSATYTFTTPFTVPASTFSICAYTGLVVDANHANDTSCQSSYGVFTSSIPYYDNFDGTVVNFSQQTINPGSVWELGSPSYGTTNSAHSAPNAWDVNLTTAYLGSANTILSTQYFNFSNAISANMKFWLNYNAETNYDGLRIDYTTDTGTTWQTLGTLNDPLGVNWYNDDNIISTSLPAWTGSSSGWKEISYKLTALNNVPIVRFRFVFTADGIIEADGVSLDDFSITIPSPKDAGVISILEPVIQGQAGSVKTVKVRIKNFGTDTIFTTPVSYVANNGTPVTETWNGVLAPDSSIVYNFSAPLTLLSGQFPLCAYTGLPLDGDNLNDTTCSSMMGVPTLMVPHSDDFEGIVNLFTPGTLWEYGVPAASTINTAYSPTHAWGTNLDGNYVDNANEYLYSPMYDFSGVDSAYLQFYHYAITESNADGGSVQYSINGGGTWITLGIQNDPQAIGWYNSNIGGVVCWSGNTNGWVLAKYRLTSIPTIINAVQPVQFRFRFFSNASNSAFNGWYIDNLSVTAPPIPDDAGVTAILLPNAATQTGTQVTVKVTIQNFGTNTLTSIPVKYAIGAVTTETWNGSLLPGASTDYTFTTSYTSPGNTYNLCAFTLLPGDTYFWNDTTCGTFATTPGAKDVGVTRILLPTDPYPSTTDTTVWQQPVPVRVTIKNFGYSTETNIPMIFQINGVQAGAGNWTGTLAPGDTVVFDFPNPYTSPKFNYQLCARTQLLNDVNPANDGSCKNMYGVDYSGIEEFDNSGFVLLQNMPNPSVDKTEIVFYVPTSDIVTFEMVDVLGKKVLNRSINAQTGKNLINFDVKQIPDGVYFYSVTYQEQKLTRRMVITK